MEYLIPTAYPEALLMAALRKNKYFRNIHISYSPNYASLRFKYFSRQPGIRIRSMSLCLCVRIHFIHSPVARFPTSTIRSASAVRVWEYTMLAKQEMGKKENREYLETEKRWECSDLHRARVRKCHRSEKTVRRGQPLPSPFEYFSSWI